MRKPAFCISENKAADQLCGDRTADQRLCFRFTDSTNPLLPKFEILSLLASSVTAQPGMCRTRSETPEDRFSHVAARMKPVVPLSKISIHYSCEPLVYVKLVGKAYRCTTGFLAAGSYSSDN